MHILLTGALNTENCIQVIFLRYYECITMLSYIWKRRRLCTPEQWYYFAVKFLCFTEVPGKERPPLRSARPCRLAGLPAPPPTACEEGALLGWTIELHGANQKMT